MMGEANATTSEEIIGGEGKFSDVYWTAGGIGQVPGGALVNIYNSENWILSRFAFEVPNSSSHPCRPFWKNLTSHAPSGRVNFRAMRAKREKQTTDPGIHGLFCELQHSKRGMNDGFGGKLAGKLGFRVLVGVSYPPNFEPWRSEI